MPPIISKILCYAKKIQTPDLRKIRELIDFSQQVHWFLTWSELPNQ